MPETAPVAPAPDAGAPTSTPTPTQAPAPTQTPTPTPTPDAKPSSKELAGQLFNLLTAPAPSADEPAKPKVKEAAAPTTPTPPKADAPAAPVADEKEIKRRKKETPPAPADAPPPIPKRADLTPAPTPAATPTPVVPKAETDAEFEKTLVDEERALIEDARAAEKYLGDKYKGHGSKMGAFLKENAKKLNDPNFDAEDPAYQKWYNDNLPKIGALDFRRMERERVKEDVKQEFEPRIEEERHARWVDTEAPKITAKANEVYAKLSNSALPDELASAIAERTKGVTDRGEFVRRVQEVQKDYALEFETAENLITVATNSIEEFHRLTTLRPGTDKALKQLHPDAQVWVQDPGLPEGGRWRPNLTAASPEARAHATVLKIVEDTDNEFKKNGGLALKNSAGKWFVTRAEWHGMAPEQRAPFWTMTNEQIVERALSNLKPAIEHEIRQRRKGIEGYGYQRVQRAAGTAPASTPPPAPSFGSPPAPRPTPPPHGGGSPPPPSIAATLAGKLTSQPAQL